MRDKEIVGLYQAYLDVYSNSNEEVEQLDEDVQGAVKGALEKGANIMKTNPVLKAVGSIIAPANPGRKTPTATSGGYRKEEVENWVNSLIEEGYDLSEYTWDDMYEMYVTEGRYTSLSALSRESQRRKEDKERGRPETQAEIHGRLAMGDFSPGASQKERARGGRQRLIDRKKVPQKGGKDMFEHILEHLVAEGYADTNESALAIMANMSEEWRQSIVEASVDYDMTSDEMEKARNERKFGKQSFNQAGQTKLRRQLHKSQRGVTKKDARRWEGEK